MLSLSLSDRTALVTGGSRGIGAAIVRMFVKAGARVVFNYQHAAAQLGRLDILVANHGIWPPDDVSIDAMADEQWHRTVAVNLDSVFGLVKHAVADMRRHPPHHGSDVRGRIVLVSSTARQRGEAFHCDYAATKGAIISMTKGLSTELARDRIYVNCVAPGWVHTDMSGPVLENRALEARVVGTIPLGRIGTPDEIAAPVLFLCTDHANFITGEVFNVNGGAVLAGEVHGTRPSA